MIMRMKMKMRMKMTWKKYFQFTCKTFVPFENSNIVSFDFSRMYKITTLVFATVAFILPAKIICWIALESASKAFCLLKSAAINL